MANAVYNVKITDVYGVPLRAQVEYESLRFNLTSNDTGYFELEFNAAAYPRGLFQLDRRVEIWRAPQRRAARLVFVGFMRLLREVGEDYIYERDYREEKTVMYVGGKGTDSARVVPSPPVSSAALTASALNRREGFVAFPNSDDTNVLNDKANSELYAARYVDNYDPDLNKIAQYEYTVAWDIGDTVTIKSGDPVRYVIGGPDLLDILNRRIVAYKTGTTQAKKTGAADDLIKEYVDENLVNATDTDRNLPARLGFSIQDDLGNAPSVEHSATFGNLLTVCQDVAKKSAEAGTVLRFWLEPQVSSDGRVVPFFRTQIDRRGRDRTGLQIGTGDINKTAEIVGVDVSVDALGNERIIPKMDANT